MTIEKPVEKSSRSSILITISRTDLKPPRESPLLGVVQDLCADDGVKCLLPEDCQPPTRRTTSLTTQKPVKYKILPYLSDSRISVKIKGRHRSPVLPLPKIFGFDVFGRPIQEERLPDISYAWPAPEETAEEIYQKEVEYRDNRLRIQNLQEVKLFSYYHKAKNPTRVPLNNRETAEEYLLKLFENMSNENDDSCSDSEDLKPCHRTRRRITTGSYPSKSVKENDLPKLLRYSWKGKVKNLDKYLSEKKNRKKINLQDKHGRSALHFAASWGCTKTAEILLAVPKVNVNLTDNEGKTPIFKAVELGSLPCVRLLVEHGCSLCVATLDGRNPFEFALQELGDSKLDLLKYLYHEGGMYKERKSKGRLTFLHICCLARKSVETRKIAEELLASKEFLNATEGQGRTPLIFAAQMGRIDLVELFLKHNADVSHIDLNTKAAIQYSTQSRVYRMLRKSLNRIDRRKCQTASIRNVTKNDEMNK